MGRYLFILFLRARAMRDEPTCSFLFCLCAVFFARLDYAHSITPVSSREYDERRLRPGDGRPGEVQCSRQCSKQLSTQVSKR